MAEKVQTDQDILRLIRDHIFELNTLSKTLQSDENFEDIEKKWNPEPDYEFPYWRGARIQVVEANKGDTVENWRAIKSLEHMYYYDEPCPSRFPKLLSGLINAIQVGAIKHGNGYLKHFNSYEFYYEVSKACVALELSHIHVTKAQLCSSIIFSQIRLLNKWVQDLEIEINRPSAPSLIQLGWRYYFAFGRNVNQTAMLGKNRCPNAINLGQAELKNHRFAIDERGYATVVAKNDDNVIGILWAISPEDERQLDRREGVHNNIYRKEKMSILSNQAAFFGGPEEVIALVYVSNSLEGNTPRTGYMEEIIEGLREALYSDRDLVLYRNFLSVRPASSQIQQLAPVKRKFAARQILEPEHKLSPRFQKLLCSAAEEVFSTRKNDDAQSKISALFAALNRCFNEHASSQENVETDVSDVKSFGNFLIDFIPDNLLEPLSQSAHLKELQNLYPLITSDKIIIDEGLDPYTLDPKEHAKLIEKASSDHKQFLRDLTKINQSFTNAKMKRFLKKLARLLYTIRSNTVHGSKQAAVDNEERITGVCEIALNVLFDLFDALTGGGLRRVAVYGELKKNGRLHADYMKNFTFLSAATIKGSPWNRHDIVWLDLVKKDVDYAAELYLINGHLAFNKIDEVEVQAERVLTEYRLEDGSSGVCWAYSNSCATCEDVFQQPVNNSIEHQLEFSKADAVALIFCINALKAEFEAKSLDNFATGFTEIFWPKLYIRSTGRSSISTDVNEFYTEHKTDSLFAIKYAAEIEVQIGRIETRFSQLYPNGGILPIFKERLAICIKNMIVSQYGHNGLGSDQRLYNVPFNESEIKEETRKFICYIYDTMGIIAGEVSNELIQKEIREKGMHKSYFGPTVSDILEDILPKTS
jgi:gamma-glutamylcyclotransferase (GGCT)/AIG2-like uncharacterized protein YtfP